MIQHRKKRFFLAQVLMLFILKIAYANSNETIDEHKKEFLTKLSSDPRIHDPSYQYLRAISIINLKDADYIPKVSNAGELVLIDNRECQVMHNGLKVYKDSYYGVEWMTDVIYALKGHHEPQEEKAFYEVLKYIPKGGVMLELGSYWAYYSLWFADQVQDATNYLIEPSLERLSVGRKHFLLNNRTGYFFQGYAGGRYDSQELFEKNAKYFPIDSFLAENQIPHLDILHADIQYAEYDMLKTCQQSIDNCMIDFFFISTHSDKLHYQCLEFFKKNGFDILAQHLPPLLFWGDGLIVAKRKGIAGPVKIEVTEYGR